MQWVLLREMFIEPNFVSKNNFEYSMNNTDKNNVEKKLHLS
jgi:hypothetical protein